MTDRPFKSQKQATHLLGKGAGEGGVIIDPSVTGLCAAIRKEFLTGRRLVPVPVDSTLTAHGRVVISQFPGNGQVQQFLVFVS